MKKNTNEVLKKLIRFFMAVIFIFSNFSASAQNLTSSTSTYTPGTMVTFSGTGYSANEKVSIQVVYLDNKPEINTTPWVVVTDANGDFQTTWLVPTDPNLDVADLKITVNTRSSGISAEMQLSNNNATVTLPVTVPAVVDANTGGTAIPSLAIIDCSGIPNPGNTFSNTNPVCAGVNFTLSLQNSGGTVTYQWQKNTGSGFVNIPGANSANLVTSQTIGTNYHCIVTCTGGGLSAPSADLLVSMRNPATCPLKVTAGGTATAIAQKLVGPGVSVSNAVLSCKSNAYGTFTGGATNLGLNDGIVLTTGSAVNLIGPNNVNDKYTDNLFPGDPQLTALTTAPTEDACSIQFDFVPTCPNINFNYVFGGEEYPEYVNSQFNDVFAFFINGPGIVGTKNMALIPGVNLPVTINNVNNGNSSGCPNVLPGPCKNCAYYKNNCGGSTIQYDGMTTVLAASSAVIAGQTYHLKIAIADAGDRIYDSGVMLQSGSLSCVQTEVLQADAVRGCNNGQVRFCRFDSIAFPKTVNYLIEGTAVNGTDYDSISSSIEIPAGQQCITLDIVPTLIAAGIVKTVKITTLPDSTVLNLTISDAVDVNISPNPAVICLGNSIVLTASGANTYNWTPDAGLSDTSGAIVSANPVVTTTYYVTGRLTASGCTNTDSVTVIVNSPSSSITQITACDSYEFNGYTFTSSIDTIVHLMNAAGCDSAAELSLIINYSTTASMSADVCDSYVWLTADGGDGMTYTAGGTFTNTTTNTDGCDHTTTLDLTVRYSTNSSETVVACDSYTWSMADGGDGLTYTTGGTYVNTTTNADGCDHTATLDLTVNYSTTSSQTAIACDSYTWSMAYGGTGDTYTVGGTYVNTTTNMNGCDHTATLTLSVNYATASTNTVVACYEYDWMPADGGDGQTYYASGTYVHTSMGMNGCMHTQTLVLTINEKPARPGIITGNTYVCAPQTNVQYCIDAVPNATSYMWSVPAGATYTTSNGGLCIQVSFPSVFTGGVLSVKAQNDCGDSDARTLFLSVSTSKPKYPREVLGDKKICPGTCKTYTIVPVAGANSYNWSATGGLMIQGGTMDATGTLSTLVNGGLTVTVCAPAGFKSGYVRVSSVNCKGASSPKKVGVKANKIPNQPRGISGYTTACVDEFRKYYKVSSSGATSFVWTITPSTCVTFTGQGTDKIYPVFTCAGTYTICATTSNECGSTAQVCKTVTVNVCTADRISSGLDVALTAIPNPVRDLLNVDFNSEIQQSCAIKLTEMTGRVVYNEDRTVSEGRNHAEINVSRLSSGIYLLSFQMGNINEQIRVVVE